MELFFSAIPLLLWTFLAIRFYRTWRKEPSIEVMQRDRMAFLCGVLVRSEKMRAIVGPLGFGFCCLMVIGIAWYAYSALKGFAPLLNLSLMSGLLFVGLFVAAELMWSRRKRLLESELPNYVQHTMYFPTEEDARGAADVLKERGFAIENVQHFDYLDALPWALDVTQDISPMKYLEQEEEFLPLLEGIATQFHGEYDGHEFALTQDASTR